MPSSGNVGKFSRHSLGPAQLAMCFSEIGTYPHKAFSVEEKGDRAPAEYPGSKEVHLKPSLVKSQNSLFAEISCILVSGSSSLPPGPQNREQMQAEVQDWRGSDGLGAWGIPFNETTQSVS